MEVFARHSGGSVAGPAGRPNWTTTSTDQLNLEGGQAQTTSPWYATGSALALEETPGANSSMYRNLSCDYGLGEHLGTSCELRCLPEVL